jgi:short-subunit dehydrogenase
MLVNNVGILNIGSFDKIDEKLLKDELVVNILPITLLSHHVIPLMLTRKSKSAIVNLSSAAIEVLFPHNAVYNATKAFDDMLSRSLADEHRGTKCFLLR